ncbi:MAG: radical SAM protein [Planctomycetota bacterium]
MRKNVVLVVPQKTWASKDHLPSLGLAYIGAVLEGEGYEVSILDCMVMDHSTEEAAERIAERNPDAVGLTTTSHSRFWCIDLAKEIKRRSRPFLFTGGPHFGLTAVDALTNVLELDAIVKGEGEETAKDLLKACFSKSDMGTVRGIFFRDHDGCIIETPDRPPVSDLNALPDPGWHLFDLNKYPARLEGFQDGRAIGVMSSRGCPFGCVFCANNAFWKRDFRKLRPEKFVDQLEHLHREYGYRDFDFWDDTFTVQESHARAICDMIIERGFDFRLYLRARVDRVSKKILKKIRTAGGVAIGFGIESGSQRVLDKIAKGITIDQARLAVKQSIDLGYIVKAFFMTSLPGEKLEDVEKTMRFVDELNAYGGDRIHAGYGCPTTIYPGTQVEAIARKSGLLPRNFSWNRPFESKKMKALGLNPALPHFENASPTIEEIFEFRNTRALPPQIRPAEKHQGILAMVRQKAKSLFSSSKT